MKSKVLSLILPLILVASSALAVDQGIRIKSNDDPYPEVFGILYQKENQISVVSKSVEEQICSGVLVHPRIILTAAHCASTMTLTKITNGVSLHRGGKKALAVKVKSSHFHPTYVKVPGLSWAKINANARYDIAFLILEEAVNGITLPQVSIAEESLLKNHPVSFVGYGMDRLFEGWQNDPEAIANYSGDKNLGRNMITRVDHQMFALETKGQHALIGDSGGPIYLEDNTGIRRLVGVLHSAVFSGGKLLGTAAHRFTRESLCWVKNTSQLDFMPELDCNL